MLLLRYGEYGYYAERQFIDIFGEDACWNQVGGLGGRVVYALAEDGAIVEKGTILLALQCATECGVGLPEHDSALLLNSRLQNLMVMIITSDYRS